MILKSLAYLLLLAGLFALVWSFPFLWEIGIAGMLGGAYWIFFREPPAPAG